MGRGKKIDDTAIVVEAAIKLIESGGIAEFSTRRLAAVLHISAMTLYNYFVDREAILKAVALRCLEDFNLGVDQEIAASPEVKLESGGNPMRAFKILARRLLAFGVARPKLYLFLFDSAMGGVREDPEILAQFKHLVEWVEPAMGASQALDEALRDDVLLFELLVNGLVVDSLRWPRSIDQARCLRLIDRSYASLLASYEARASG